MKIHTSPHRILITINGVDQYIMVNNFQFDLKDVCRFLSVNIDNIRSDLNIKSPNDTFIERSDLMFIIYKYASKEIQVMFQVRVFNNSSLIDISTQCEELTKKVTEYTEVVLTFEKLYTNVCADVNSVLAKYPSCDMFNNVLEFFRDKIVTLIEKRQIAVREEVAFRKCYDVDNYNTRYEPDYVRPPSPIEYNSCESDHDS